MLQSIITATGSALPKKIVTNKQLEDLVETNDEWIQQRTGITQRYIAQEGETTVSLGYEAAKQALQRTNLSPEDIDLLIVATATPDNVFPSCATQIQHKLGIKNSCAFDIHAVCSGFIFALNTADMYIKAKKAKNCLVIGAETFSRIIDWQDRTTCVLFGDGAGAVILQAQEQEPEAEFRGIIAAKLCSDGSYKDKLYVDGGVSTTKSSGFLRMQGKEVFKFAVSQVLEAVEDCLHQANVTGNEIDWFVPHQANKRIIEASAKKLNIAAEKIILTVNLHGNTSAASIPLALDHAVANNKFKENDLILLEAVGGGFTWGAMLLRW